MEGLKRFKIPNLRCPGSCFAETATGRMALTRKTKDLLWRINGGEV